MKNGSLVLILVLSVMIMTDGPALARKHDRVADDFKRADRDNNGQLDRAEWHRRGNFERLDTDQNASLSLKEVRAMYAGHDEKTYGWPPGTFQRATPVQDPGAALDRLSPDELDPEVVCAITRRRKCKPKSSIERGFFATGLGPVFPKSARCPGVDDYFAMDYTFKRNKEAYHGGIDLPVPWGTPMIAAADGTIVGVFEGRKSARGIEVLIRHSPIDTGLPLWIYTGYGHLDAMPDLTVGQRISRGEVIGPTGNSGVSGKSRKQSSTRRPAVHFSAFFSDTGKYAIFRNRIVIPQNGWWMDPVALYRGQLPVDSKAMKSLPQSEKGVPIALQFDDGEQIPPQARFIWPYTCKRPG